MKIHARLGTRRRPGRTGLFWDRAVALVAAFSFFGFLAAAAPHQAHHRGDRISRFHPFFTTAKNQSYPEKPDHKHGTPAHPPAPKAACTLQVAGQSATGDIVAPHTISPCGEESPLAVTDGFSPLDRLVFPLHPIRAPPPSAA